MERFSILAGLPATGPWPEQFSETGRGTHSEGFVVEFFPEAKPPWVGNLQRGGTSYNAVLPLPNGNSMIVVAGGQGYIIEPEHRSLLTTTGGQIESALAIPAAVLLILSNVTYLEAWGPSAMRWRTRRISWDGIWDLKVNQDRLKGMAWNAIEDCEAPFSVDLETGEVDGGGYTEAV
jgi:hypothetical protein